MTRKYVKKNIRKQNKPKLYQEIDKQVLEIPQHDFVQNRKTNMHVQCNYLYFNTQKYKLSYISMNQMQPSLAAQHQKQNTTEKANLLRANSCESDNNNALKIPLRCDSTHDKERSGSSSCVQEGEQAKQRQERMERSKTCMYNQKQSQRQRQKKRVVLNINKKVTKNKENRLTLVLRQNKPISHNQTKQKQLLDIKTSTTMNKLEILDTQSHLYNPSDGFGTELNYKQKKSVTDACCCSQEVKSMLKQICNNHNYIINLLNTYVLTNNVNNGIMNLKDENEAHVYKNEIRKSMTEPVRDQSKVNQANKIIKQSPIQDDRQINMRNITKTNKQISSASPQLKSATSSSGPSEPPEQQLQQYDTYLKRVFSDNTKQHKFKLKPEHKREDHIQEDSQEVQPIEGNIQSNIESYQLTKINKNACTKKTRNSRRNDRGRFSIFKNADQVHKYNKQKRLSQAHINASASRKSIINNVAAYSTQLFTQPPNENLDLLCYSQIQKIQLRQLISRRFQAYCLNYNYFLQFLVNRSCQFISKCEFQQMMAKVPFLLNNQQTQSIYNAILSHPLSNNKVKNIRKLSQKYSKNSSSISDGIKTQHKDNESINICELADRIRCFIQDKQLQQPNRIKLKMLEFKQRIEQNKKVLQQALYTVRMVQESQQQQSSMSEYSTPMNTSKSHRDCTIDIKQLQNLLVRYKFEHSQIQIILSNLCVQSSNIHQIVYHHMFSHSWVNSIPRFILI